MVMDFNSTNPSRLTSSRQGLFSDLFALGTWRAHSQGRTIAHSSFLGRNFHAFMLTSRLNKGHNSNEYFLWGMGFLLVIFLLFLLMTAISCVLASCSGKRRQSSNCKGNFPSEKSAGGTQPIIKDDSSSEGAPQHLAFLVSEEEKEDIMAQMLKDAAEQIRQPTSKMPGDGVADCVPSAQDRYIAVRPAPAVDTTGRKLTKLEQWTEASLSLWKDMEEYFRDVTPNGSIPLSDIILVHQNPNGNPLEVVIDYKVTAEGTKTPGGLRKGLRLVESMELLFSNEVDSKSFAGSVTRYIEILRTEGAPAVSDNNVIVQKYTPI